MSKSFASQVRDILRIDFAGRDQIDYRQIALKLDFVTDKEKQRLYSTLRDFIKRKEVERIRPGVIRYIRDTKIRPAKKTSCMWRLIRANRNGTVTKFELMANCDVTETTARAYLQTLVRRGLMRHIPMKYQEPSKYKLIDDPGPHLIRDDEAAFRLRKIRAAKKSAVDAIDQAAKSMIATTAALSELKTVIDEITEDENA